MARLAGVDIPRDKRVEVALTYIYGVGRTRALETLTETGISGDIRVKDLTDDQLIALRDYIEGNYKVEGDLRREVAADIRRKVEIGCYEGIRHRRGLPVRGQRTKTNARTRKGPKRTVAGKKKARKARGQRATQELRRSNAPEDRRAQAAPQGEEEHRRGPGPHQVDVQQHDRLDHRPDRCCHQLGSSGGVGFKGSRKSTPFAAQLAAEAAAKAQEHGMKKVDVFVKGPGSGRETAIRSLQAAGLEVGSINDVTPRRTTGAVRRSAAASKRFPAAQELARTLTGPGKPSRVKLFRPNDPPPVLRHIADARRKETSAHCTATHTVRREHLRIPFTVRHRAAGARLRLHPRKLPAPHPALLDPRRGCHQHPDRRHAARVHHHSRCEGGRHRDHPQHQEPVVSSEHDEPITAYLRKQGAGEVTAADISPPAGVEIHNPDLVIATLNEKGKFELELTIERGRGYVSATRTAAIPRPARSRSTRSTRPC